MRGHDFWNDLPYMWSALPYLQLQFSSMNVEFIQHPYPTSPIFIKCLLRKVKFWESKVIKCMNIICIKFSSSVQHGAGIKIMSAHAFLAFLGQLRFWMDTIWVARWNGLKILIPKHMWKSKIRLLEPKLGENRYITFLAVQNSSIGDLVTDSLSHSVTQDFTNWH